LLTSGPFHADFFSVGYVFIGPFREVGLAQVGADHNAAAHHEIRRNVRILADDGNPRLASPLEVAEPRALPDYRPFVDDAALHQGPRLDAAVVQQNGLADDSARADGDTRR